MENKLTIQQMKKVTGLSAHTLRYYEKIGLLTNVCRDANGYRSYSNEDIAWLEFLLRLKETGMPLAQIKLFADLRSKGESTVKERRILLEQHEKEVSAKIKELKMNLKSLSEKINYYKDLENNS